MSEGQILNCADKYASLHVNKELSPDQHWSIVCAYKQGFIDSKNQLLVTSNRTEAEDIAFYEAHLNRLENNKDRLSIGFYLEERAAITEKIWRLKNYQQPTT